MKKFAGMLCLALLVLSFSACGSSNDGSLDAYLQQNGLGDTSYTGYVGDTVSGSSIVIDEGLAAYIPTGGDAIPESLVGNWSYVELYQSALASDITVEEAINREKGCGLSFGYVSFYRYGEGISDPVYKTNTAASYSDMINFGIDPSGLKDIYGDTPSITAVTVYTAEGQACTTVFLINDSVLLAFGQGMNVFMYEAVEAVG